MTKQKNLQRDFIMNFTIPKKFLARAESHIAVKIQKSWFFGIGGRIFWARAPKIFFRIEKFMQFERFFLGDPVYNVVKLTKTVLYMGEMNHYFLVI